MFIDRDGALTEGMGLVSRPEDIRLGNAGKDGLFPCDPERVCADISAAADWVLTRVEGQA